MNWQEIKKVIEDHGGQIDGGINWTWAIFPDDIQGQKAFAIVGPHVEHRGYYLATPESQNPNLHLGGFRFR